MCTCPRTQTCTYIHICIYIYMYIHTHTFNCMSRTLHVCRHMCIHTYIHACIHINTYLIHACCPQHKYMYIYTYMHIFIYIYTYIQVCRLVDQQTPRRASTCRLPSRGLRSQQYHTNIKLLAHSFRNLRLIFRNFSAPAIQGGA